MAAKKKRAVYSAEFKADAVLRASKAKETGSETYQQIADEIGTSVANLFNWVSAAKKASGGKKTVKKKPSKKGAESSYTPLPPAETPAPSLELKGLRGWVAAEVKRLLPAAIEEEMQRRFGGGR